MSTHYTPDGLAIGPTTVVAASVPTPLGNRAASTANTRVCVAETIPPSRQRLALVGWDEV